MSQLYEIRPPMMTQINQKLLLPQNPITRAKRKERNCDPTLMLHLKKVITDSNATFIYLEFFEEKC